VNLCKSCFGPMRVYFLVCVLLLIVLCAPLTLGSAYVFWCTQIAQQAVCVTVASSAFRKFQFRGPVKITRTVL